VCSSKLGLGLVLVLGVGSERYGKVAAGDGAGEYCTYYVSLNIGGLGFGTVGSCWCGLPGYGWFGSEG